jgi:hypothetical protein
MVSFRLTFTTLVAFCLVAAAARAQDSWTLTTADFRNA